MTYFSSLQDLPCRIYRRNNHILDEREPWSGSGRSSVLESSLFLQKEFGAQQPAPTVPLFSCHLRHERPLHHLSLSIAPFPLLCLFLYPRTAMLSWAFDASDLSVAQQHKVNLNTGGSNTPVVLFFFLPLLRFRGVLHQPQG